MVDGTFLVVEFALAGQEMCLWVVGVDKRLFETTVLQRGPGFFKCFDKKETTESEHEEGQKDGDDEVPVHERFCEVGVLGRVRGHKRPSEVDVPKQSVAANFDDFVVEEPG